MSPSNLPPPYFLGRPIKPVALGLMLAMGVVCVSGLTDTGVLGASAWGDLLSAVALVAVVFFLLGWLWRLQPFAELALAVTVGVFATRAAFVFLLDGALSTSFPAAGLSLSFAVVACGSFALERLDPKGQRSTGEG